MRFFLASIVAVISLVSAGRADAQWRSERPYRGLFASSTGETEQSLIATGSLGGGWDTNLIADAVGRHVLVSDVTREFRGSVGTGSGALSYSLNRPAVALGATAGTTVRYYPRLSDRFLRREYASVGTSANLGAGFSAHAGAVYQPYDLRTLMPTFLEPPLADPSIVDEDFPASLEHYFGYSAGADYTRRLTRRHTVFAGYGYRGRERAVDVGRFEHHHATAGLTYAVATGLSLQFGYGYSQADYDIPDHYSESHIIDAGVNYSRPLSLSRRTTLSFGTGSTASRRSRTDALRFRANGTARLVHEIGRTWNASISYRRGLQFVEAWPEPVFSDSAMAGLSGLLNRRIQAQLVARALRGRGYFTEDRNQMVSYGGAAGLTVALTRHINSGVVYSYYLHDLGDRISLAPGLPRQLERHSVRGFVSMWVPLFHTPRRP